MLRCDVCEEHCAISLPLTTFMLLRITKRFANDHMKCQSDAMLRALFGRVQP